MASKQYYELMNQGTVYDLSVRNNFTVAGTATVTGAITATAGVAGNVTGAVVATTPVNATASTLAVTQSAHAGRTVTLNRAAGIAVTLPNATGTGSVFRFVVGTTVTSNTTTIKVARAADAMQGVAYVRSDNSAAVLAYSATAGTDDTVTMDGSTTGGLVGDVIEVIDIAANRWQVLAFTQATGTEATPFSNTVS